MGGSRWCALVSSALALFDSSSPRPLLLYSSLASRLSPLSSRLSHRLLSNLQARLTRSARSRALPLRGPLHLPPLDILVRIRLVRDGGIKLVRRRMRLGHIAAAEVALEVF